MTTSISRQPIIEGVARVVTRTTWTSATGAGAVYSSHWPSVVRPVKLTRSRSVARRASHGHAVIGGAGGILERQQPNPRDRRRPAEVDLDPLRRRASPAVQADVVRAVERVGDLRGPPLPDAVAVRPSGRRSRSSSWEVPRTLAEVVQERLLHPGPPGLDGGRVPGEPSVAHRGDALGDPGEQQVRLVADPCGARLRRRRHCRRPPGPGEVAEDAAAVDEMAAASPLSSAASKAVDACG